MGFLRVNTDETLFATSSHSDLAFVVRNHQGQFIYAHCKTVMGVLDPAVAKALSVREALRAINKDSIGIEGGVATPLATHVSEHPILFANDLDIHQNGSIFFTDTSSRYDRVNHFFILLEGESTGRLLRYDPPTKTTHVVLDGLAFPNGVQLSKDQTFLLFTETTNCRIMKYWLEGPKTGKVEVVADLPGFPDNIRMNEKGEFWVAIDCCRTPAQEVLTNNPWLRSIYFRLPIRMSLLARLMGMKMYTVISLFNENGEILEVLEDPKGVVMKLASEVRQVQGKLWIGTVAHNHITTLPYP